MIFQKMTNIQVDVPVTKGCKSFFKL